jgi:hypothetical protein
MTAYTVYTIWLESDTPSNVLYQGADKIKAIQIQGIVEAVLLRVGSNLICGVTETK